MDVHADVTPLSFALFKPVEGGAFGLCVGETMLDLVLTEVSLQRAGPDAHRPPFSLMFDGTVGRLCPQGIYRLHNAVIGGVEMFLVPIGRSRDDSYRYQAVFA